MFEKASFVLAIFSILIGMVLTVFLIMGCSYGGCNQILPLPFLHFFVGTISLFLSKSKSGKDKTFVFAESTRKALNMFVISFGVLTYTYAFLAI